jgi:hypothetical protein
MRSEKQFADLPDCPVSAGRPGREIALPFDFVHRIGNCYREPDPLQDR